MFVLDTYLKRYAGQEQRRNVSTPYVLTKNDDPRVWGYYTLSAASVLFDSLPEALAKHTKYDMIPAALIGRLAIDDEMQEQGVGRLVLVDALRRLQSADTMAFMLVVVDPKDDTATRLYSRFGFERLSDGKDRRMFIPFSTIKNL